MKSKNTFCELVTPFENGGISDWQNEHPSPQLRRDDFLSLCGEWRLSVLKNEKPEYLGIITVPFAPESRISGINRGLKKNEKYVYEKEFTLPEVFAGKHTVLHFGAVDQTAEIYINGVFVLRAELPYLPFEIDITENLKQGGNTVKVVVTDNLDKKLPYGKQSKKRGGMWYTPISGIWQPVWLEAVPEKHIEELKITAKLSSVTIKVIGGEADKTVIFDDGRQQSFKGDTFEAEIENPINWTPENPHLYHFTLICGEDRVQSYFALRTVTVEKKNGTPYICLNGKPYFFNGLLDQGYFSDGIYTPASPKGYIHDIKTAKESGFNMLRKHIKIEPQIFYYYCDKYGMAVFQDAVNSGGYSFVLDTVLPTVGIKKGLARPAGKKRKEIFLSTAIRMLERLYNHPCVCYYTIFNEGWGQFDADKVYEILKNADPTRIHDTASGWFVPRKSDVTSVHTYFKKLNLKPEADRPLVLSEFGGYSCKIPDHSFNLNKTYGYKYYSDTEAFTAGIEALYREQVIPEISKGLCAAVLTQLSDVEDETNGILTYDRQVTKPDIRVMKETAQAVFSCFEQKINFHQE